MLDFDQSDKGFARRGAQLTEEQNRAISEGRSPALEEWLMGFEPRKEAIRDLGLSCIVGDDSA